MEKSMALGGAVTVSGVFHSVKLRYSPDLALAGGGTSRTTTGSPVVAAYMIEPSESFKAMTGCPAMVLRFPRVTVPVGLSTPAAIPLKVVNESKLAACEAGMITHRSPISWVMVCPPTACQSSEPLM